MPSYCLLNYDEGCGATPGLLVNDAIYPVVQLLAQEGVTAVTTLAMLENWSAVEPLLFALSGRLDLGVGISPFSVRLLPPVLYPNAIYCAAANYRDHMKAMALRLGQPEEPDPRSRSIQPYHFVVPGRTGIAGPADPIRIPAHGSQLDWEVELVAVIGLAAKNVSPDHALEHVAGYCVGNDISVRDHRYIKIPNVHQESVFRNDFIGMKAFDQACAIGPWMVPARQVSDPQALALKLWIDDVEMQDSSTDQMVFSVAEQISYLSARVTLLPGDLIMTGTPAGTGMERGRFLKPGETVRMSIENIGEMTQLVVA